MTAPRTITLALTGASGMLGTSLGHYLDDEPPTADTDRVFVVSKGQRRGQPLSADGLDEVLSGARRRAGAAQQRKGQHDGQDELSRQVLQGWLQELCRKGFRSC